MTNKQTDRNTHWPVVECLREVVSCLYLEWLYHQHHEYQCERRRRRRWRRRTRRRSKVMSPVPLLAAVLMVHFTFSFLLAVHKRQIELRTHENTTISQYESQQMHWVWVFISSSPNMEAADEAFVDEAFVHKVSLSLFFSFFLLHLSPSVLHMLMHSWWV